MTDKERKSCIRTIELLRRLAFNVHGVMDVIDAQNCDKIIEMLSKPESKWIPCSERLPELDDEVLVTDDRGELRHCIFCTWGKTWCGFITYEEGMRIKPVAWMPLPSPYQPEEESE